MRELPLCIHLGAAVWGGQSPMDGLDQGVHASHWALSVQKLPHGCPHL